MDLNGKNLDKLLECIYQKSGENFAILTADDLEKDMDKSINVEDLFDGFNALKNKGLIFLKYNDGKSFCCAVTPRGKDLLEKDNLPVVEDCKNKDKISHFLIFIYAFLGSAFGCVVVEIIRFFSR